MRFQPLPIGLSTRRSFVAACASGLLAPAWADDKWPSKPVRMVVSSPAGSTGDVIARVLCDAMSRASGQPFIVDNKPGANSSIGANEVSRAAPDGHTLMLANTSSVVVNPQLYKKLSYTAQDFAPVSAIVEGRFILAVNPAWAKAQQIETASDFIAWAKKNPGKVRYGSAGLGNLAHLTFAMFNKHAGIDTTHIPYKGSGPAQNALIAGEIEAMFDVPNAIPFFESGRLKPLAVTAPKRLPALPQVPTLQEIGFKGFDVTYWMAVQAPAKTPPAVVNQIHAALMQAASDPKVRASLSAQGDVILLAPAPFAQRIQREIALWGDVIRREGLSLEQ